EKLAQEVEDNARFPWWVATTANNLDILCRAEALASDDRKRVCNLRDRLEVVHKQLSDGQLSKAEDALYVPGGLQERGHIPVLLRVTDPAWRALSKVDCRVIGQLGNVVSAAASGEALRQLDCDPRVLAVQTSRAVPLPEADPSSGAVGVTEPSSLDLR